MKNLIAVSLFLTPTLTYADAGLDLLKKYQGKAITKGSGKKYLQPYCIKGTSVQKLQDQSTQSRAGGPLAAVEVLVEEVKDQQGKVIFKKTRLDRNITCEIAMWALIKRGKEHEDFMESDRVIDTSPAFSVDAETAKTINVRSYPLALANAPAHPEYIGKDGKLDRVYRLTQKFPADELEPGLHTGGPFSVEAPQKVKSGEFNRALRSLK